MYRCIYDNEDKTNNSREMNIEEKKNMKGKLYSVVEVKALNLSIKSSHIYSK